MTREEAIRILDPETSRDALWKYEGDGERLEMVNEACRIVVAALQAQQDVKPLEIDQFKLDRSRWEGCPACRDRAVIAWDLCGDGIVIESDGKLHMLTGGDWECEIQFCPECGRPLTEEAWAELERRINGEAV